MDEPKRGGGKKKRNRLQPLEKQLHGEQTVKAKASQKGKKRQAEREGKQVVDTRITQKILRQAREQLDEEAHAAGDEEERLAPPASSAALDVTAAKKMARAQHVGNVDGGGDDDGDDDDDDVEDLSGDGDGLDEEKDFFEELEIDAADEAAVEAFLNPEGPGLRNLADIVMAKIREAEAGMSSTMAQEAIESQFHPKVLKVYRDVGLILSRYHSGKLPKPFKVIPRVNNWEELLFLTKPEKWTPQATYHATVIFSSNLSPAMAQRFYHLILLPAIRSNIATTPGKKLHPVLFRALRKSLYKPAAFFRGILLPMAEGGDCTLREAAVLGAIVSQMSIPPIHASAAILKLCKIPHYNGPTSLFLRCLLNKKYALAYRVIDAVVNHFLSFMDEHRTLPVLWHQALLTFVQRYKDDVTDEQKEALKPLLKKHTHHQITPEIRRELFQSKSKRVQSDVVDHMDLDEDDDE